MKPDCKGGGKLCGSVVGSRFHCLKRHESGIPQSPSCPPPKGADVHVRNRTALHSCSQSERTFSWALSSALARDNASITRVTGSNTASAAGLPPTSLPPGEAPCDGSLRRRKRAARFRAGELRDLPRRLGPAAPGWSRHPVAPLSRWPPGGRAGGGRAAGAGAACLRGAAASLRPANETARRQVPPPHEDTSW